MIKPDISKFMKLAQKGSVIPVYREIIADLETPVSTFLKLAAKEKYAYLLESVEGGEQVGRYSFIGIEPNATLSFKRHAVTRRSNGAVTTFDAPAGKDPLHVLHF